MPDLRSDCPIMEGLMAGQCFTEHDGVHCYPAIRLETGEKYIIKVVCVPASETQMEALQLTGAIADANDAKRYFHTLAQEVVAETRTLNSLALLEGFVGCEMVHCEENDAGNGYLVYILTPYRETAESLLKQSDLSQHAALELGLNICAALTACRRAGFMYVDLKPDNIFKNEQGDYCIGDIGFITLRSLKYASLPEKYRSSYTAPEMADCFAQLNDTLDVYALGLLLYQMYNGGVLPFDGNAPEEQLAPPVYADYELSEIILKACDPDPANRWPEPAAIGQALAEYMQRNEIGDAPIVPPIQPVEPEQEPDAVEAEEFLPDMSEEELLEALAQEESMQEGEQDELQLIAALAAEDVISQQALEDPQQATDDDTAQILAQAEELMTLVPPEPVIAPEAIHVPIPEPIVEESISEEIQTESPDEETPVAEEPVSEPEEAQLEEPVVAAAPKRRNDKKKRFPWGKMIACLVILLLLAGLGYGGFEYYNETYLQYVDAIHIVGTDSTATVTVISRIDDSLLTLVCTDSYGNSHPAQLHNGMAKLEGLNPQTRYTVSLRISGFHQLQGETTKNFTTASRTQIQSFQASIGPTDGSVTLSFTFSGPEPQGWKIIAAAQDQETVVQEFTGTAVTVSGLHIGSEYTFLLEPVGELFLSGQTQVSFTAAKIIYAMDPVIEACHDGLLQITWKAPEDTTVESWTVRCFNASGYDVTVTTTDTTYTFQDLDHSTAATVEITAAGMNKSVSTTIGPDPVTIWNFPYTAEVGVGIHLGWTYTEKAPAGGWILHWSLNGLPQQPITCEENSAFIPMYIPGGVYEFTLETTDSTSIFGGNFSLTLPYAQPFAQFGLTGEDIVIRSFLQPADETPWQDLPDEAFADVFAPGDPIRILLTTQAAMEASDNSMMIQYILRDQNDNIISTEHTLLVWNDMWTDGGCVLAPSFPATPGEYVLSLYFDGMILAHLSISMQDISQPSA